MASFLFSAEVTEGILSAGNFSNAELARLALVTKFSAWQQWIDRQLWSTLKVRVCAEAQEGTLDERVFIHKLKTQTKVRRLIKNRFKAQLLESLEIEIADNCRAADCRHRNPLATVLASSKSALETVTLNLGDRKTARKTAAAILNILDKHNKLRLLTIAINNAPSGSLSELRTPRKDCPERCFASYGSLKTPKKDAASSPEAATPPSPPRRRRRRWYEPAPQTSPEKEKPVAPLNVPALIITSHSTSHKMMKYFKEAIEWRDVEMLAMHGGAAFHHFPMTTSSLVILDLTLTPSLLGLSMFTSPKEGILVQLRDLVALREFTVRVDTPLPEIAADDVSLEYWDTFCETIHRSYPRSLQRLTIKAHSPESVTRPPSTDTSLGPWLRSAFSHAYHLVWVQTFPKLAKAISELPELKKVELPEVPHDRAHVILARLVAFPALEEWETHRAHRLITPIAPALTDSDSEDGEE